MAHRRMACWVSTDMVQGAVAHLETGRFMTGGKQVKLWR